MKGEDLFFLIIIGIPAGAGLIALLGYGLFRWRQEVIEAALKQEMLQRGMSADDIVRVLKASKSIGPLDLQLRNLELNSETKIKETELKLRHELKQAELKLKHEMVQRGMSADDIVRVLQTSRIDQAQERSPEPLPLERVSNAGQGEFFVRE
jgi:hypothetical protein